MKDTNGLLIHSDKAAAAPTAAAVCLPAFFVPRGLSRLASAADSGPPRAVSPVALLVVEQSVAGRAATRHRAQPHGSDGQ